jgi:hypothetical protein
VTCDIKPGDLVTYFKYTQRLGYVDVMICVDDDRRLYVPRLLLDPSHTHKVCFPDGVIYDMICSEIIKVSP